MDLSIIGSHGRKVCDAGLHAGKMPGLISSRICLCPSIGMYCVKKGDLSSEKDEEISDSVAFLSCHTSVWVAKLTKKYS